MVAVTPRSVLVGVVATLTAVSITACSDSADRAEEHPGVDLGVNAGHLAVHILWSSRNVVVVVPDGHVERCDPDIAYRSGELVVFDVSDLTLSDDFDFHCTLSDGTGSVDGAVPLDYQGLKCAPTDLAASYEQLQCGLATPWFVHQPDGSSVNVIVTYEALASTT